MRREEQLDEREITGDLGGWLVRTGKATAADADRLSIQLRREWAAERIVAMAGPRRILPIVRLVSGAGAGGWRSTGTGRGSYLRGLGAQAISS